MWKNPATKSKQRPSAFRVSYSLGSVKKRADHATPATVAVAQLVSTTAQPRVAFASSKRKNTHASSANTHGLPRRQDAVTVGAMELAMVAVPKQTKASM